ncbi:MAG: signal recognition particle protein Srp54 [Candidatus Caldarchaeum sp.]|nr:signal recognition particle protein Srp54 [Candidatus Caldarchaeum sp.]MCS7137728.1 signal recognition particle protein Srp54 [Candidatus Caldarchaeum sp.]MDW7977527.1 signal recognition particle protein Srp54 [Candidatus Caldarchaeum sp.]
MSGFASIGKALKEAFAKFLSSPTADRKAVEELVRAVQRSLLMADVKVELVSRLSDRIKERALTEKLPPGVSRKDHVAKIVYEELTSLLGKKPATLFPDGKKPYVLMLLGIQGTGKTTTAAKLANYLKTNGHKVGVVCADTYRPAAYAQLRQLLQPRGIEVYGEPDSTDPVKIARQGLQHFKNTDVDFIIVDTAGRHKSQDELMEEMKSLEKTIQPDENILVIDGTIGQQAGVHAAAFHKAAPVGSIIVTKLDTSAKGGGALSAVAETGASVKFIGVGEALEDFEPFNPSGYVASLLGMPDIESLVERVRMAELEMDEEKMQTILTGRFTLEDMVNQLTGLTKLGPLKKILAKLSLPGLDTLPENELEKAEERIKKWTAIVKSMTAREKQDPAVVDSSRVRRIARGAGVSERDVRELLKSYQASRKMMKDRKLRQMLRQSRGLP